MDDSAIIDLYFARSEKAIQEIRGISLNIW